MAFDEPKALEALKALLGITGQEEDDILHMVIADCIGGILSYCRRRTLPIPLEGLVPVMAVDLYRSKGYGAAEKQPAVKSVTQDKRSVTYQEEAAANADIIKSYALRLDPYIRRCGQLPSEVRHEGCI